MGEGKTRAGRCSGTQTRREALSSRVGVEVKPRALSPCSNSFLLGWEVVVRPALLPSLRSTTKQDVTAQSPVFG